MNTVVNSRANTIEVLDRGPNGERTKTIIKDFYPSFYHKDPTGTYTSLYGDKLKKRTCLSPYHLRQEREHYEHFEADLKFEDQYLLDKVTDFSKSNLRYWLCDIEVDAIKEFPKPEEAKYEIIVITFYDSFEDKYVMLVQRSDLKRDKSTVHVKLPEFHEEYDITLHTFPDEKSLSWRRCRGLSF